MNIDELIVEADRAYKDIFNVARRERDLIRLLVAGIKELLDRVAEAEHELEKYDRRLEKTENEYNRLETSHSILERALQRVRELHQPRMNSMSALYPEPLCSCQSLYPCATIRALEGDE